MIEKLAHRPQRDAARLDQFAECPAGKYFVLGFPGQAKRFASSGPQARVTHQQVTIARRREPVLQQRQVAWRAALKVVYAQQASILGEAVLAHGC